MSHEENQLKTVGATLFHLQAETDFHEGTGTGADTVIVEVTDLYSYERVNFLVVGGNCYMEIRGNGAYVKGPAVLNIRSTTRDYIDADNIPPGLYSITELAAPDLRWLQLNSTESSVYVATKH